MMSAGGLFSVLFTIALFANAAWARAQSYNLLPPTTMSDGWTLNHNGTAMAVLGNGGQTNGVMIRVDQVDGTIWDVGLVSPPVALSDGLKYTLTFVARASIPAKLDYKCSIIGPDYHSVGLYNTVALTESWHKYRFTFQVSKSSGFGTNVTFMPGYSPGSYWISSVRLVQGAPTDLADDSSDPNNWVLEANGGDKGTLIKDGDALKAETIAVDALPH